MDSRTLAYQLRGLVAGYLAMVGIAGAMPALAASFYANGAAFDWWVGGTCIIAFIAAALLFFRIRYAIPLCITYIVLVAVGAFAYTQHRIYRNPGFHSYYSFTLSVQLALNALAVFALLAVWKQEKLNGNQATHPPN